MNAKLHSLQISYNPKNGIKIPTLTTYIYTYDLISRINGEYSIFYEHSEMNAEKARIIRRCGHVYITRGIYGKRLLCKVNDIDITPDCITYYVEKI